MQVYSRNKYRFMQPEARLLEMHGKDMAQILGKQVEFKDAFFELEPDKFQEAPDWIANDLMFKMALKDGDIKLVRADTDTSIPPVPDQIGSAPPETSGEPSPAATEAEPGSGGKGSRKKG